MHNQFRQHRIIKRRNHIPVIRRRIHPYSKSPRQMHLRNLPRTRPEILRRILRINPALNRMPRKPDLPLRHRQRHPRSHPKLLLNQIHPRDPLRHRMLHLNPRIHLHKIKIPVRLQQKLNRPRIHIMRRLRRPDRRRAHPLPQRIINRHARRLLNHLLMIPLNRAVPLAKMNHIPKRVRHNLKLHMTWMTNQPLHIHRPVRKRTFSLLLRRLKRALELPARLRHAHTLAAASKRRLNHHRKTNPVGLRKTRLPVKNRFLRPRNHRHTGCLHRISRLRLITQTVHHLRRRPNPRNVALLASPRKRAVLRQESKSRMNRIRPRHKRRTQNTFHI